MRYRFYMNGQQVHEPGVEEEYEISPELFRDEAQRVMTVRIDGSLKWGAMNRDDVGDAYTLLYEKFRESFCNRVAFHIEQRMTPTSSWEDLFTGFIYATDCTFDTEKKIVEAQITDNSFSAQIDSNRSIKFNVTVPIGKSGAALSSASQHVTPNFFTPSSGFAIYNVPNVDCYTVQSVIEFLVRAMSDAAMTASAPIFEPGGDFERLSITTGASIRAAAGGIGAVSTPPVISFEQLWASLWRQFNLWMRISGNIVVIEKESDQYQAAVVLAKDNVQDIIQSCEQDRLYTNVNLGSQKHTTGSWPDLRLFTHKPEEYGTTGVCNHGDQNLDLQTEMVTASNVIEDIIVNDNDEYDEDVFIVELNAPAASRARKYDYFAGPPFVYNGLLVNMSVAQRWQNSLPTGIAFFGSTTDNNFQYNLTSASGSWGAQSTPYNSFPIDYDTLVTDVNGRYNAGGDYYDVPTDGSYTFEVRQRLNDILPVGAGSFPFDFDIVFQKLTSGGSVIAIYTHRTTLNFPETILNLVATQQLYLSAGERVRVQYIGAASGSGVTFDINAGSFLTTFVTDTGVAFQGGLVNMINWKFPVPITQDEWFALRTAPTQKVVINGTETWIRSVKWDSRRQMADGVFLENVSNL